MSVAKQIGKMLKEERKLIGLSQKNIADILLISQQKYSLCEKGVAELGYEQILTLCKFYSMTPNEFFEEI